MMCRLSSEPHTTFCRAVGILPLTNAFSATICSEPDSAAAGLKASF